MKSVYRGTLFSLVVLILAVSFSGGFAADKKLYPTSPPSQIPKKWRIGYYEAGPYKNYPLTFIATVKGLEELGWLEPITIPPQEDEKDASKLWAWLAANVRSKYLEFVPDAFYSYEWKKELRDQTRQTAIRRLKETRDIDLMLTLGTQGSKDLVTNEHSVPTVVCSVSDAVASQIISSAEDSGYNHVHAMVDPQRFVRQIYAFHDLIGFKKLGITLIDSVLGRSYAAIDDIKRISKERNFEFTECYVPEGGETPENNAKTVACAKTLAPQIDAFYLIMMSGVNKETIPQILSVMNDKKIPVFSQAGSDEVRYGALLSIATSDNFKIYGKFHAEAIAKIINGAKPRDLNQICDAPAKIAFNKETAKLINLRDDIYQLLVDTAQEVYDKIEAP